MAGEFVHQFMPGRLPVTVLLLHGSGGDENDLLPVGRAVAPGAGFLSPRGKVLEHGMPRFFKRPGPEGFDQDEIRLRCAELAAWVAAAALEYGLDPLRIYALGYSNGANMAGAMMLLRPGVIAGSCLLRARLVVEVDPLPDLAGAPVLLSAGQSDLLIPVAGAEALGKVLTSAGARVDLAVQNAGHDLTPADFSLAKQWFGRVLAGLVLPGPG
jgi:phospholipase/carboxylesterase